MTQDREAADTESSTLLGVKEPSTKETVQRVVIIDGANSIYRAFFAIPHLEAPDKTPTNAVMGFATMLGKVIREESPTAIVVAFDPRGGSFRRRIFDGYKANREAQPEDLSKQIPLVRELVESFQIPILEVEDFEADDVIATLVHRLPKGAAASIISTDKDLMQLVSDRVELVDHVKNRRFGPAEVEERFGVPPEKILDVRSLIGDPSDNIPGVKGIGEKGAAKLITEWGTLEELLDHADEVKAKKAREALISQRAEAELSKELSTLREDVELSLDWDALSWPGRDVPKLRDFYERMGFTRLITSLENDSSTAEAEAAPENADQS
ncbi:DNA polymerase I, partial [Myxococcota bacterium]|nr:DNA polymerase I [Myxococcota bacterium]